MVEVTLEKFIKEPAPSTRVLVRWADGNEQEFPTVAAAREYALEGENVDTAKRILLGRFFAGNHDGANPATIEGRTLTMDLLAQNTITVRAN